MRKINLEYQYLSVGSVLSTRPFLDERGAFFRAYCENDMSEVLNKRNIAQINISENRSAGTIRGIHYQRQPNCEMKFVQCIKGAIWDVAVDLRRGSTTFASWHAVKLSSENKRIMVIPEGFGHAFQTLEDDTMVLYMHSEKYNPDSEDGFFYKDSLLNISWPLPVSLISQKDKNLPAISTDFLGVSV